MAVTAAFSGYGATLQLSDGGSPAKWSSIAELVKISGVGVEREMLEATNLESPQAFKEFVYGLKTSKQFSAEVNWLPTNSTHVDLLTNTAATSIALAWRAWRFILPDFGAVTKTYTVVTSTLTSTSHGFLAAQPVKLTTSGTLPTGHSEGRVYWVGFTSTNALKLYNTPGDAISETSVITASGGSGTHTLNGTSIWAFSAAVNSFTADMDPAAVMRGTINFTVTGTTTITP